MRERDEVLCLGIESSAHTFGVSIASDKRGVLCDVNAVYKPPPGKGIHPREASQHHSHVAPSMVKRAFEQAGVSPAELDAIAYCKGPGLGPCLRVGATVARTLASALNKPLTPVHHAIGHIEIAAYATGAIDPLVVLVSGGHTSIAAFAEGRWRVFGETEDITLGNLIDMFAREIGLPSPAGPAIEELAKKGKNLVDLPYLQKGNDVSYSGLLTAALAKYREGISVEDLAYSLQEVAFAELAEAAERALALLEKRELLLTGGVAANKRLQEMLKVVCEEHDARFYVVPMKYAGDCGAQIAWTGVLAYKSGVVVSVEESFVSPRWRFDEVDVPWRS